MAGGHCPTIVCLDAFETRNSMYKIFTLLHAPTLAKTAKSLASPRWRALGLSSFGWDIYKSTSLEGPFERWHKFTSINPERRDSFLLHQYTRLLVYVRDVSESGRPRILNTHAQRPRRSSAFYLLNSHGPTHHFQLDQGVMPPRKDRLHTFVYLFSEEQRETVAAWKCVWGLTSHLPWFPSFLILPCSLLPFIHQPDYILYLIAILWPFAFARSLVIGLPKSNSFLLATVTVAIVIGWDSSVGRESHPSFLAYRN